MYVKLLTAKNIEKQGKMRSYKPGDWVPVGKQLALRWVANNEAWIPESDITSFIDNINTGILCIGNESVGRQLLYTFKDRLSASFSDHASLKWPKTMIWDPEVPLRNELVPIGFHLLDTWQIVCPVFSYDQLACDIGENDDKKRTKDLIHDLRVPLYDSRLMFIKRCSDTQYLLDCWQEEQIDSNNQYHSFLRAIYRAKPLILPLPLTWTHKDLAYDEEK